MSAAFDFGDAGCAICGTRRIDTFLLVEGKEGRACDVCVVASVAQYGLDQALPVQMAFRSLDAVVTSLDGRTPHADVDPLLGAMQALAAREPAACLVVHGHARRFACFRRAVDALEPVVAAGGTGYRLHMLAAQFSLGDRVAFEATVATLARAPLDGDERVLLDVYRALSTFAPTFDGELAWPFEAGHLPALLAAARARPDGWVVSYVLLACAMNERGRDPTLALRLVDEAVALHGAPLQHLVRGDVLSNVDREGARAAWQTALELAHPDSPSVARARSRLDRSAS
jgi:hypothetical protein